MSAPSTFNHHRARQAALSRSRTPDDPELVDARQKMRAEGLADYIKKIVDAAPPLTNEQRDKLALLLRPAGDAT